MSKGVKARVNLMVAKLKLPKHNGKTATFFKKENTEERSWVITGLTKKRQYGRNVVYSNVLAINFHMLRRSSFGECGKLMTVDCAEDYNQKVQSIKKAWATSSAITRPFRDLELRCIVASGENFK